jgi:hypothetical protein
MMLESIIERQAEMIIELDAALQASEAFGWVLLVGGIFAGYVLGLIVSWLTWKGGRR